MAKQNFLNDLKNEMISDPDAKYNVSTTENGALGYETTGSLFVDVLFMLPSLRKEDEENIMNLWRRLYATNSKLAILFLFYIGDIRKGCGERRTFRTMLKAWATDKPLEVEFFLKLVPEYSRWDIIFDLIGINEHLDTKIGFILLDQISEDKYNANSKKPISLLGKWLPSYNTSSEKTKAKARKVAKLIGFDLSIPSDQRMYRILLRSLRNYIKVVESYMSHSRWGDIDYSAVPSKANLKYMNAFNNHDHERYTEYIKAVAEGKAKINASVAFPSDIVHKYDITKRYMCPHYEELNEDPVLEEMWKALPSYETSDDSDIICVVDTSGSMTCSVSGKMTAMDVANAIGIYFAEHDKGAFRNSFITFSNSPKIVKFDEKDSLADKLNIIIHNSIVANTNIEAVFNLILETAVNNHYTQSDIPGSILIISDMEFDNAVITNSRRRRLFQTITQRYEAKGFKVPKLIFWNVNSRSNTIPVCTNENGVILVSGYSVNTMKMVLSKELDSMKALLNILFDQRYEPIAETFEQIYAHG